MTKVSRVFAFLALCSAAKCAPEVVLGGTKITGLSLPALQLDFFGGIPFAVPPIGERRFTRPELLKSPTTPNLTATTFGPRCVQNAAGISEDCLTINIHRPAGITAEAKLPVMLWVYGGGFLTGSGANFNGSQIVAQSVSRGTPVIYVNFNYRLGPLGFPQGAEAIEKGALNLGLHDQLTAARWVQENIEVFGGDKKKVTIFGESAGAISIALLFLNSGIENLARAAIFESGSQSSNRIFNASRDGPFFSQFIANVPECAGFDITNAFECLRTANTTTLLAAERAVLATSGVELFPFGPVIDSPNGIIPDIPSKLLAKGRFSKLPFISGTNRDEGTIFTPTNISSTEDIVTILTELNSPEIAGKGSLENAINELLEMYPNDPAVGSPFGTGNNTFGLNPQFKRLAAIFGDMFFQSVKREWVGAATKAGVKTFVYHFGDPMGNTSNGVPHGSEIVYVYGGLPATASAAAMGLSKQMTDYWISFATSLDPNDGLGVQRPEWPHFTLENKQLIQLNSQNLTVTVDTFREEQIAFINSVPLVFHH